VHLVFTAFSVLEDTSGGILPMKLFIFLLPTAEFLLYFVVSLTYTVTKKISSFILTGVTALYSAMFS
jgi:hypothetical protein